MLNELIFAHGGAAAVAASGGGALFYLHTGTSEICPPQINNPFVIPVCALLSVLEGVKILKLSLGLLLVCVAIFRVPAGAYGSLRASPFFDSFFIQNISHPPSSCARYTCP